MQKADRSGALVPESPSEHSPHSNATVRSVQKILGGFVRLGYEDVATCLRR